jgi:Integrase zinc binding domain
MEVLAGRRNLQFESLLESPKLPKKLVKEAVSNAKTAVDTTDKDQSLLDVVAGGRKGLDIPSFLRNRYNLDLFFKNILENPKHYKNFASEDGLIYIKMRNQNLLCIPKMYVQGQNIREIVIAEAHSLLAHLGASKTLAYLRDNVWWKDMASNTTAYCQSCMTCKRSKPSTQKPTDCYWMCRHIHGNQLHKVMHHSS